MRGEVASALQRLRVLLRHCSGVPPAATSLLLLLQSLWKRSWPKASLISSVALVMLGCIIAGIGDLAFDARAYTYALSSVVTQACYLLLVEFQVRVFTWRVPPCAAQGAHRRPSPYVQLAAAWHAQGFVPNLAFSGNPELMLACPASTQLCPAAVVAIHTEPTFCLLSSPTRMQSLTHRVMLARVRPRSCCGTTPSLPCRSSPAWRQSAATSTASGHLRQLDWPHTAQHTFTASCWVQPRWAACSTTPCFFARCTTAR